MNVDEGFELEVPPVMIPWEVTEGGLKELLGPHGLREVATGYFTITCQSLSGLKHELGFHFTPRGGNFLQELEFFRISYPDRNQSYEEFQKHLEIRFGKPSSTAEGSAGFPTQSWDLKRVEIVHCVRDRFGPEEHVRMKRKY